MKQRTNYQMQNADSALDSLTDFLHLSWVSMVRLVSRRAVHDQPLSSAQSQARKKDRCRPMKCVEYKKKKKKKNRYPSWPMLSKVDVG